MENTKFNTKFNEWPREEKIEISSIGFISLMMQYSGFEKQQFRQIVSGSLPEYNHFLNVFIFRLADTDLAIGFGIENGTNESKFWKFGTLKEWIELSKQQTQMFKGDNS